MSQYIYRKNQDVLWNVVQIIPISASLNRENVFKQCIKMFHDKNKHRELNFDELQELNKETIEYIIHNYGIIETIPQNNLSSPTPMRMQLHRPERILGHKAFSQNYFVGDSSVKKNETSLIFCMDDVMSSSQPTVPIFSENKSQKSQGYSSELEYRQTEYTNMTKREGPKEISFLEKNEDTVIENMEELVAEYLKQRELDTPVLPQVQVHVSASGSIPPNKVKIINNEIGNIDDIVQIMPDEFIIPIVEPENNTNITKKSVQWNLNLSNE